MKPKLIFFAAVIAMLSASSSHAADCRGKILKGTFGLEHCSMDFDQEKCNLQYEVSSVKTGKLLARGEQTVIRHAYGYRSEQLFAAPMFMASLDSDGRKTSYKISVRLGKAENSDLLICD